MSRQGFFLAVGAVRTMYGAIATIHVQCTVHKWDVQCTVRKALGRLTIARNGHKKQQRKTSGASHGCVALSLGTVLCTCTACTVADNRKNM